LDVPAALTRSAARSTRRLEPPGEAAVRLYAPGTRKVRLRAEPAVASWFELEQVPELLRVVISPAQEFVAMYA